MIIVLTTALGLAIAISIYLSIKLNKVITDAESRQMIITALQHQSTKDAKIINELKVENALLSKTEDVAPTEVVKQTPRRSRKPKQAPKQA
jgi:hypothetical protein